MQRALILIAAAALLPGAAWRPKTKLTPEQQATHLLNRAAFGAAPGDIEKLRAKGVGAWIEEQLHPERLALPESLNAKLGAMETLRLKPVELAEKYPPGQPARQGGPAAELVEAKLYRAVESPRQLEEVLVDFWFNHFNVSVRKGVTRYYLASYENEAIRPHVLGKFSEMLRATARHPAMLFYLDNWQSIDPEAGGRLARRRPNARARGLNENYARELMELHTLGVDGGYTQKDVTEVARCFTGWTIDNPRRGGAFRFASLAHDGGTKTVLGTKIDAGGQEDGERVLTMLAAHPSTARFISRKLAARFVSDTPPAALVERMAKEFSRTGGDLRAVMRVLLTGREFWSKEAFQAKRKTPFEFAVSALRASRAEVFRPLLVAGSIGRMGMPLYQKEEPTGYAHAAETWGSSNDLLARMNFATAIEKGRLPGTKTGTAIAAAVIGGPEFQKR